MNDSSIRRKKLFLNTSSSIISQVATIICGFVLPRLILNHFGSEVNGLVNSITQFLSIIAFLELGIGSVLQFSLYKPLAEKNEEEISKVLVSGQKFFTKIALILLVYVLFLMGVYPLIANQNFGFVVSAKYSCGFPDPQVLPIIVVDRYLDYFTTIMEDRLWQVLAKPVFRWRNRSGLSMNAAKAA